MANHEKIKKVQPTEITPYIQNLGFTEVGGIYGKEIGGQPYTFKSITEYGDFQATIPIQQESFNIQNPIDICPADMLATLKWTGGSVIAGYDHRQQMVSFIYLWPTKDQGSYVLDMIGVAKEYQDKGVGHETLKVLMLESIKRGDIKNISLTYDPLQGRNANVYINKMGGVVDQFKHNPYGDALAGDRFVVSYDLSRPNSVVDRIARVNTVVDTSLYDFPHVRGGNYPNAGLVVLQAPSECDLPPHTVEPVDDAQFDFPITREQWGLRYRRAGDHYINELGYVIKTFVTQKTDQGRQNYYLLEKTD